MISAPVISVGEETSLGEIASLLTTHRIKRVPVVRDGRKSTNSLERLAEPHGELLVESRACPYISLV